MTNHSSPMRQWEGHSLVVIPLTILSGLDQKGKSLSGTALRLWIALASFTNSKHECWPSNRTLQHLMPDGTTIRTIQRAKQELVDAKLITVTPRLADSGRQTSDLYVLFAPKEGDKTDAPECDNATTPEGDQNTTVKGGQSVTALTNNNELNHKEKVNKIFIAWCESAGKNVKRTKLDSKRERLIKSALESYSEEDVLLAVKGWRNSPFHCGKNTNNKVYNDLSLLLRDAAKIEQFRDFALQGKSPEMGASWSTISEILEEETSTDFLGLNEGKQ